MITGNAALKKILLTWPKRRVEHFTRIIFTSYFHIRLKSHDYVLSTFKAPGKVESVKTHFYLFTLKWDWVSSRVSEWVRDECLSHRRLVEFQKVSTKVTLSESTNNCIRQRGCSRSIHNAYSYHLWCIPCSVVPMQIKPWACTWNKLSTFSPFHTARDCIILVFLMFAWRLRGKINNVEIQNLC